MKKRILSLVLIVAAVMSLFSLTSCKQKTTYEIVSEAINKTMSLESVDLDFDEFAKTTTEILGKSVNLTVESDHEMKIVGFDSEDSKFEDSSVTTVSGQAVRSETYYDGEYYYVDSNGSKEKIDGDSDNGEMLNVVNNIKTLIMHIPEKLLTEIELKENEDEKTKILELEISDEDFEEIFEDYIDLQLDLINKQYDDQFGDLKLKNVTNGKISLVINDEGYLESYTVSSKIIFYMEFSSGGRKYDVRIAVDNESSFKFNNLGKSVSISAPDDIDDYKLQEK